MTNAIQKFCIARSVKLHAEQEESKHRDEVFRVMQSKKKPVVVRADGRIFLVSLDRENVVIPEAYLAWVEDGVLCDDPASGDSQVVVDLSIEVFTQVEEVAKTLMGRRCNGAAFRRLIAYSLPNGGKP